MKTFLNIALLSICILAYAANAAIEQRAKPVVPPSPPTPWVAPSPSCQCPNCSCETCRCDGGVCRCVACAGAPTSGWLDYRTGYPEAKRMGRPSIIFVTTADCPPCKALEKTLAGLDLSRFVCIKIDASREPALAAAMQSAAFPHLAIYGADGELRSSRINPTAEAIRADLATAFAPIQPTATPAVQVAPRPTFAPVRGFAFSRSGC